MKTRTKLCIYLMAFALLGCYTTFSDRKIPIKPFYVIGKDYETSLLRKYTLVDKNGYQFQIVEMEFTYAIGDTIR